jgi:hypothetical protein
MRRTGLVIAMLSALGSAAQAQPMPPTATGPAPDPNRVTPDECAKWHQTLSAGKKLSEGDQQRFYLCVEDPSDHGIAPPVETYYPQTGEPSTTIKPLGPYNPTQSGTNAETHT